MTPCRWEHAEKCESCGAKDPEPAVRFVCTKRGALCLECWMTLPACHCGLEDFDQAKAAAGRAEVRS